MGRSRWMVNDPSESSFYDTNMILTSSLLFREGVDQSFKYVRLYPIIIINLC